jgi:hypothetical protein
VTRKGTFIVKLDLESGAVIKIEKKACPGRPTRLGEPPAEREVCGMPGRHQVGGLWLCVGCFRRVVQDAEAYRRASEEQLVMLDKCLFPAGGAGRLTSTLCGLPATAAVSNIPVCADHYGVVLRWHRELSAREEEARKQLEAEIDAETDAAREAEMRTWAAEGSQIVYYLRRGDGAVKIGTSANPGSRFDALVREHGDLHLLLTHCGDYGREREMHHRFADLCIRGEWFRPEPPLLEWIIHVRRKHVNMQTRSAETVPLRYVLGLLREARQAA